MAKGNLFLGTAARSVGDVVMYRREGSQVSRVRVRKIANPKTDAQCEQRAFMSAVVKFYQPLANVLDRSWQGLSRAKSYAKFLKTNASIVRAAGYYLRKDTGFFPLPLQLSNGTIPSLPWLFDSGSFTLQLGLEHTGEAPTTVGQLSVDLVANGYHNGDVVTCIAFIRNEDSTKFIPVSIQFAIDTTSTDTLTSISGGGIKLGYDAEYGYFVSHNSDLMVGGAIIIARPVDGSWHRSTEIAKVGSNILSQLTSAEAKAAAIASYKGAAASDNPLVYLDGDELDNA